MTRAAAARRLAWLCCAMAVAAGADAAEPAASAPATQGPALVRFKASLFNRHTGELSADVLAGGAKAGRAELLNVVGPEYAADAALVSLEIRAPAGDIIAAGTRVRVRVVDTDALPYAATRQAARPRVLVDKTFALRRVAVGGRAFIAVWLPSVGCAPVSLSAEFVGVAAAAKLADTIAFVCHE